MLSRAFRLQSGNGRLTLRSAHHGARLQPRVRQVGLVQKRRVAEEQKTDAQLTTEKYGLEAGLVKVLTEKPTTPDTPSRTEQAKQLLAQYGSAYLITSISFAVVSFSACYALVSAGVDVPALVGNLGLNIESGSTGEAVGTFAIAYAAHKALSPVRFPPTVALTPVVAQWLKRDKAEGADSNSSQQ